MTAVRSYAAYRRRMPRIPKPRSAEVLCSQPNCVRPHTQRCATCTAALCPGCVRLARDGSLVCPVCVKGGA